MKAERAPISQDWSQYDRRHHSSLREHAVLGAICMLGRCPRQPPHPQSQISVDGRSLPVSSLCNYFKISQRERERERERGPGWSLVVRERERDRGPSCILVPAGQPQLPASIVNRRQPMGSQAAYSLGLEENELLLLPQQPGWSSVPQRGLEPVLPPPVFWLAWVSHKWKGHCGIGRMLKSPGLECREGRSRERRLHEHKCRTAGGLRVSCQLRSLQLAPSYQHGAVLT